MAQGPERPLFVFPSELWVPSSAWPAPQLGLGTERKEEDSPSLGGSVRLAGSRPPFRIHTVGLLFRVQRGRGGAAAWQRGQERAWLPQEGVSV